MQIIQKDISDLKAYSNNNKKHHQAQLDVIKKSLVDYGWINPVVCGKNGEIVAGHGRIQAVKQLIDAGEKGWSMIPCVDKSDLTTAQIRKLRIIDNKSSEMAEWDIGNLKVELDELGDIELNDLFIEMDDLKLDLQTKQPEAKEDDYIQPTEIKTDIKRGDLITFEKDGKELHRLLCGDSTSNDDVGRLMNGEKADMVFTDPPYLMDFNGTPDTNGNIGKIAKGHDKIKNDKMSEQDWNIFLDKVNNIIKQFCDGGFYICFYRLGIDRYFSSMERVGVRRRNLIIRNKGSFSLSNSDYKSQYEPIIYGWMNKHNFYGGDNGKDVRDVPRTKINDLHPTMKPIDLIDIAISNSSKEQGKVLDLFGCSGSTMVACHQLNRRCYMQELDEKYCQVITDRMHKLDDKLVIKKNGEIMKSTCNS